MQAKYRHGGQYPELLALLPVNLQEELLYLKNFFAPYTRRVYMVGGSVRDLLRNQIFHQNNAIVDLDLEVYGIGEDEFAKLMQKLGAKGVGKSFFVYKYKHYIDISLPRIESKVAKGHRGFAVQLAKDEQEASMRRDFRMNALMLNIFDGKLLDFWGGIEDIIAKRIAIIDEEKFKEDSLRVLRAMQFSARFGYKIEQRSCQIMQKMDLGDLSQERIFWEFEKMFLAKWLHYGLYYLLHLCICQKIFGVKLDRVFFFTTARELAKSQKNFEEHLYKFYFLYIFTKNQHRSFQQFLDILHTPNEYYRAFKRQKYLPRVRTNRFLAGLATNYPLQNYLGNYKEDVKIRAKQFGFWKEKFVPIKPAILLAQGYSGKELGQELRRRTLQIIRERF
ncbi:CCA tRNA nucleotidyltransferase [Nitratiruptor tergarcus]|uniref:tRNA nucleotidyltransferase (CCA-adding enzyme) n=1 Tax=Nitratiruptor tergarcus DSM 16512 TaxID=1069081 RepID=A0A1W1WT46_9BACT|nr:CCA tRNA nucleotidyltransferase [Nitratiruptor tergarcus]SMC09467.1 tRNA nucleotidyltransferase (CCA-adding enzyme) [Nitratiruptor tergarcus DSM 16512]